MAGEQPGREGVSLAADGQVAPSPAQGWLWGASQRPRPHPVSSTLAPPSSIPHLALSAPIFPLLVVTSSPHPSYLCPACSLLHSEETMRAETAYQQLGSQGHTALQPQTPSPCRTCECRLCCCRVLPARLPWARALHTDTAVGALRGPQHLGHLQIEPGA